MKINPDTLAQSTANWPHKTLYELQYLQGMIGHWTGRVWRIGSCEQIYGNMQIGWYGSESNVNGMDELELK